MPNHLGNIERRLALVILVTALLPLASAMLLAYWLLNYASSVWLRPEVEQELQHGIELYKAYVRVVKEDMKDQTAAMAGSQALREVVLKHDATASAHVLQGLFAGHNQLVSLTVEDESNRTIAEQDRGRSLDEGTERKLEVRRGLGANGGAPTLVATFAFDRRYEQELERAGDVHDAYAQLQKERARIYAGYYEAFAVLLGITVVATVVLGFFLARGITRRINRIATAIHAVTAGDLNVRVPVTGSDELADLARVFNRMLSEMQHSRARIEYLQRIGAWQEMAQRLAHEIKNPLTPIQLAVQECHRKYGGEDLHFRALLDTTLEIVEEEVGTLRRLVGNFSNFARLPHAELFVASLRDFLRECSEQLSHLGAELAEDGGEDVIVAPDVDVRWELPVEPLPIAIDRQMFRRVLVNLVRNAVEAIRDTRPALNDGAPRGHVLVRAEQGAEGIAVIVEDDGPGVPEASQERIFDPYFTTKPDGTGLGLAIVKKVVVEHNGAITVNRGARLGGAAFVVELPFPHSVAIVAAEEGDVGGALSNRAIASRR
ncbi:MAG: ATP-binding protein [Myxococcota bacterium]|nr:ATP-binding protein [Myxococcota bacterium]